jgi:ureidoglycolate lyase
MQKSSKVKLTAHAPTSVNSFAIHELRLVEATPESLEGYGWMTSSYEAAKIEITPWPTQGRRPIDPGTGDQAGTVEGIFEAWWAGDVLYGRNNAVGDSYLFGWSCDPRQASEDATNPDRSKVLFWHANYHPDGGQLFFPLERKPFIAPLALPGDEVTPTDFVAFYFGGNCGLYIHPGIWHAAPFPLDERATFAGKQGAVHARVSCDFAEEFGTYLQVPMRKPS